MLFFEVENSLTLRCFFSRMQWEWCWRWR